MAKKPKKPKRVTKAQLLRKARTQRNKDLIVWAKAIKERDGHKCQVCGQTDYLNSHHLISKRHFPHLRLELMCGIALCSGHHSLKKHSAHQNGIWFSEWLRINKPEQFAWAVANVTPISGNCEQVGDAPNHE